MIRSLQGKKFLPGLFRELLLYSGQYALFYILMNFSKAGIGYFQDFGHTLLLAILLIQTSALVLWGERPIFRFLFSLIAPAIYTALETREGLAFVLNMGHIFFWIFSFVTGALQAASLSVKSGRLRQGLEFLVTWINVAVFIVVYFYFDVQLTYADQLKAGQISRARYNQLLQINLFFPSFYHFLQDPAHVYLLIGGMILATSLSAGRANIVKLKEKISRLFGLYIDKKIRDKIIESDETARSEKRELCILFSDIRNFTSISESSEPDQITAMLNQYFTLWDDTVREFDGIIDKYIGDAVMVIFGHDGPAEAADNAVECAVSMLKKLPSLQKRLEKQKLPVIRRIGIGINFGDVIIGDIGSADRRNYTVIGDNVNVASRLESLTKQQEGSILISKSVYIRLTPGIRKQFSPAGKASLKGKTETVEIYKYSGL